MLFQIKDFLVQFIFPRLLISWLRGCLLVNRCLIWISVQTLDVHSGSEFTLNVGPVIFNTGVQNVSVAPCTHQPIYFQITQSRIHLDNKWNFCEVYFRICLFPFCKLVRNNKTSVSTCIFFCCPYFHKINSCFVYDEAEKLEIWDILI